VDAVDAAVAAAATVAVVADAVVVAAATVAVVAEIATKKTFPGFFIALVF